MTPEELVQNVLVGSGVAVSNVTYNGWVVDQPQDGSGSFSNGATTNLGLDAGIILSSGLAPSAIGAAGNQFDIVSDVTGTGSDPDLLAITTSSEINDRAVLEFDFVPTGDSVKFNYVFASEEHPGFDCSPNVNDVFGFFLSGPGISGPYTNNAANIALVPNTNLPVSIASIHGSTPGCPAVNEGYYVNNLQQPYLVFGGFTTVLQAVAQVECGQTYHIKLAIGDAGDDVYNSAVFLEAGSFASSPVPSLSASTLFGDSTIVEGCVPGTFIVHRPVGDTTTVNINYLITGTATNGSDYTGLPASITIPAGQDSVVFTVNALEDGVSEAPETVTLAVFVVNACGDTLGQSATFSIVDYQPMVIHTETNLILTCDQDSIPLLATYTGGYGNVAFTWNDTLDQAQIWVPGMEDGQYVVSASDDCPRTEALTVNVDAGCAVIIPNVITPNGDGSNDKFVVRGILGKDNRVQIWDRWGKEVLSTYNYRNNFGANDLHDGTYFYKIKVLDKEYNGYFNVLGSK